jgi:hypothetical protein
MLPKSTYLYQHALAHTLQIDQTQRNGSNVTKERWLLSKTLWWDFLKKKVSKIEAERKQGKLLGDIRGDLEEAQSRACEDYQSQKRVFELLRTDYLWKGQGNDADMISKLQWVQISMLTPGLVSSTTKTIFIVSCDLSQFLIKIGGKYANLPTKVH